MRHGENVTIKISDQITACSSFWKYILTFVHSVRSRLYQNKEFFQKVAFNTT